ncbi:MAG: TIR domain-containing protein [Planctomycetota bacterium]
MKDVPLFLGWSGQESRELAESLRLWIPNVIQSVRPFVSSNDIEAGAEWFNQLRSGLVKSEFAILCITSKNVNKPWVNFESGVLRQKHWDGTLAGVVPLLIDLEPTDLPQGHPMVHLQAKRADQEGVRETLGRLADLTSDDNENGLTSDAFGSAFEKWWADDSSPSKLLPRLQATLKQQTVEDDVTEYPLKDRATDEKIDEVLQLLRNSNVHQVSQHRSLVGLGEAQKHNVAIQIKNLLSKIEEEYGEEAGSETIEQLRTGLEAIFDYLHPERRHSALERERRRRAAIKNRTAKRNS